MYEYGTSEDHKPVAWWRGHPVYATHFIVLVLIVSMVATAILMAFNVSNFWGWMRFSSSGVLRGEVWRIVTYGAVNPPSLWFVIDMAIIAAFGREVEKFFGQRKFMLLYGCIYLLPPLLFTLVGLWFPSQLTGQTGALAVFVAFATLYPDVSLFWGFPAKWIAVVLVAIYSLTALADRDWIRGVSLWATSGFAFAFVRYERGAFTLPRFRLFNRGPRLRLLPDLKDRRLEGARVVKGEPMAEVDALLDKIARSGVSSLTAKERATLDSARNELLRRGSPRR